MPTQLQNTLTPFDNPAADIIVRSSDNVDFRCLKAILGEASSVFKDMFSLPSNPSHADQHDGLPIVCVTETGRTLDNLLRFCYPIVPPGIKNSQEICEALDAARKYMMKRPEKDICEQFGRHAKKDPLGLYAFASKHVGWQNELMIAAEALLRTSLDELSRLPALNTIDVASYIRLQNFHQRCGRFMAGHVLSEDEGDWPSTRRIYFAPHVPEHLVEHLEELVLKARHTTNERERGEDVERRKRTLLVSSHTVDGQREEYEVDEWLIHLLEFVREAVRHKPHIDTLRAMEVDWDMSFGGIASCRCDMCTYAIPSAIGLIRRYMEDSFELLGLISL
ncbi:hypothetical protein EIP91_008022 [Steccherinum ochraceum]|uniref:BTB domain-containing protein n=1 Tax=Steccherinum ochraceum TaxID=92696 RepID=A0A4R0R644_9APHY|nr:hypothetical protein EIP91_008022 [Steccherinum ochraceum]